MADKLRDELLTDPLGRGYSVMDNEAASVELNAIWADPDTRERNRTSMSSSEVYNAIDQTEWALLSAGDQQELWDILHLGDIDPFGREKDRFTTIFGGGSVTIAALADARKDDITRAQELGITAAAGLIEVARR